MTIVVLLILIFLVFQPNAVLAWRIHDGSTADGDGKVIPPDEVARKLRFADRGGDYSGSGIGLPLLGG
jgi:hypothetical protein